MKFLIESTAGFIFWVGILTPYMLLVVDMNVEQYKTWFIMNLYITPVLAPASVLFINKARNLFIKE